NIREEHACCRILLLIRQLAYLLYGLIKQLGHRRNYSTHRPMRRTFTRGCGGEQTVKKSRNRYCTTCGFGSSDPPLAHLRGGGASDFRLPEFAIFDFVRIEDREF